MVTRCMCRFQKGSEERYEAPMGWFLKTTRHLDRLLVWIGAFGLVWAGMIGLSTRLTRFGEIGVPEAVFIGLGAASVLALALSILLIGWRVFRPLPRVSATGVRPIETDGGSDALRDLDERFSSFIVTYGKHRDQKAEAEEADRLALRKAIGDLFQVLLDDLEYRSQRVSSSLHALFVRETMQHLNEELVKAGDQLMSPEGYKEKQIDWNKWETNEERWKQSLTRFTDLASPYSSSLSKIWSVNPEEYRHLKMSDDLFPDYERAHRYKTFRIVYEHYLNEYRNVQNNLNSVAFSSIPRGVEDARVREALSRLSLPSTGQEIQP